MPVSIEQLEQLFIELIGTDNERRMDAELTLKQIKFREYQNYINLLYQELINSANYALISLILLKNMLIDRKDVIEIDINQFWELFWNNIPQIQQNLANNGAGFNNISSYIAELANLNSDFTSSVIIPNIINLLPNDQFHVLACDMLTEIYTKNPVPMLVDPNIFNYIKFDDLAQNNLEICKYRMRLLFSIIPITFEQQIAQNLFLSIPKVNPELIEEYLNLCTNIFSIFPGFFPLNVYTQIFSEFISIIHEFFAQNPSISYTANLLLMKNPFFFKNNQENLHEVFKTIFNILCEEFNLEETTDKADKVIRNNLSDFYHNVSYIKCLNIIQEIISSDLNINGIYAALIMTSHLCQFIQFGTPELHINLLNFATQYLNDELPPRIICESLKCIRKILHACADSEIIAHVYHFLLNYRSNSSFIGSDINIMNLFIKTFTALISNNGFSAEIVDVDYLNWILSFNHEYPYIKNVIVCIFYLIDSFKADLFQYLGMIFDFFSRIFNNSNIDTDIEIIDDVSTICSIYGDKLEETQVFSNYLEAAFQIRSKVSDQKILMMLDQSIRNLVIYCDVKVQESLNNHINEIVEIAATDVNFSLLSSEIEEVPGFYLAAKMDNESLFIDISHEYEICASIGLLHSIVNVFKSDENLNEKIFEICRKHLSKEILSQLIGSNCLSLLLELMNIDEFTTNSIDVLLPLMSEMNILDEQTDLQKLYMGVLLRIIEKSVSKKLDLNDEVLKECLITACRSLQNFIGDEDIGVYNENTDPLSNLQKVFVLLFENNFQPAISVFIDLFNSEFLPVAWSHCNSYAFLMKTLPLYMKSSNDFDYFEIYKSKIQNSIESQDSETMILALNSVLVLIKNVDIPLSEALFVYECVHFVFNIDGVYDDPDLNDFQLYARLIFTYFLEKFTNQGLQNKEIYMNEWFSIAQPTYHTQGNAVIFRYLYNNFETFMQLVGLENLSNFIVSNIRNRYITEELKAPFITILRNHSVDV